MRIVFKYLVDILVVEVICVKCKDLLNKPFFDGFPTGPIEVRGKEDWEKWKKSLPPVGAVHPYIDVWNCRARVMVEVHEGLGRSRTEVLEDAPFKEEELRTMVEAQGGAINISGWYKLPRNAIEKIKAWGRIVVDGLNLVHSIARALGLHPCQMCILDENFFCKDCTLPEEERIIKR